MPTPEQAGTSTNQTVQIDVNSLMALIMQQQQEFLKALRPTRDNDKVRQIADQIEVYHHDPNSPRDFDHWYNRYSSLFLVDGVLLLDAEKCSIVVRRLGADEHARFTDYIRPKGPEDLTLKETIAALKKLYAKKKSLFKARLDFLGAAKGPDEDASLYGARINRLHDDFKMDEMSGEHFKCLIFILGLQSPSDQDIRARLLQTLEKDPDNTTIDTFIDEVNRIRSLKEDLSIAPAGQPHATVKKVQQKPRDDRKQNDRKHRPRRREGGPQKPKSDSKPTMPCWLCGGMHWTRDCSYKANKCRDCQVTGHREGYCASAKRNPWDPSRKRDQKSPKPNGQQRAATKAITVNSVQTNRKFVTATINQFEIQLQLDTASDLTLISRKTWEQIKQPTLTPFELIANDANGNKIDILGSFEAAVTINRKCKQTKIAVSQAPLNLLGLDLLHHFELLDKPINQLCLAVEAIPTASAIEKQLKEDCPQAFRSNLGKCKNPIKLFITPQAKPAFIPARNVAFALRSRVEEELSRLEADGIITPINYSRWAAPIVVVKKASGKLRICADYSTGLNDQLQDHCYPIPVIEDIYAAIGSRRYYSIIDVRDAYFQVEVEESCREYLTINTHRGLYSFNRLPQGIKPAAQIFQQLMETIIGKMPQVFPYIDDIILASDDQEEHIQLIKGVVKKLHEAGFSLSLEKCQFFRSELKCLGFIISQDGLKPDPDAVAAIREMPAPTNLSELRSLLGSINFYQRFVKNMANIRAPLDALLKKDAIFIWSPECDSAFAKFKDIRMTAQLCHYSPDLPLVVASDASMSGIGATLMHRFPDGNLKTIKCESRSLAPAEKNYSQIEKEALGIVWAVEKFHKFVFGRRFSLQTDHRPLLTIYGGKKGVSAHTSNRLVRWGLKLNAYDFDISYVNTTKFGYVDVLSRLIPKTDMKEDLLVAATRTVEEVRVLQSTIDHLPLSFEDIRKATLTDPTLMEASKFVANGWPDQELTWELTELRKRRNDLSIIKEVIIFQDRIVIPLSLQQAVLDSLHEAHAGINATKMLARSYVYWPGLDTEIERLIKSCEHCLKVENAPTKNLLHSWPKCDGPWQRVHIDYAQKDGRNFFVLVDSFTKYPEIIMTTTTTSSKTITMLREIFARHGLPKTLVSDNGPQFKSESFELFMRECGVEHLTIAPYHPNSNGQAERFVQTLKRALEKMHSLPTDLALSKFLLQYRSLPNQHTPGGVSPSEALFGRQIRTKLDLLKPNIHGPTKRDEEMEEQYNRHHGARNRRFKRDERVKFRAQHIRGHKWETGVVLENIGGTMYNVLLDQSGKLIRAHTDQLTSIPDPSPLNQASQNIDLNLLLDTFDLPPIVDEETSAGDNDEPVNNEEIPDSDDEDEETLTNGEDDEFSDESEDTIITISDGSFHSINGASPRTPEAPQRGTRLVVPVTPPLYARGIPKRLNSLGMPLRQSVHVRDTIGETMEGMTQHEREDFLDEIFKEAEKSDDSLQE